MILVEPVSWIENCFVCHVPRQRGSSRLTPCKKYQSHLNITANITRAYVFAVGHNKRFIYAKQHPLLPNSPDKIDKTVTNFYIIERTKNEFQDKPKYGPFTKETFDSLCLKLDIKNPEFDMTYPTNLY